MDRRQRIEAALRADFAPARLEIVDDSLQHAGHSGAGEGGETHYHVRIVSARFQGLSRVARHRLVNASLADEFTGGLHALAIVAAAPGEA